MRKCRNQSRSLSKEVSQHDGYGYHKPSEHRRQILTDLKCVPRAAEKTPHIAVFARPGALRSSIVNKTQVMVEVDAFSKKSLRFVPNYRKSFPAADVRQFWLRTTLIVQVKTHMSEYEIATPRPGALIESLRSIGYDLPTAVADIIDNSLTASARQVDIVFHWAGANSWICILDDGTGMSDQELFEAMRPGSQNPLQTRSSNDLGRFGLGLKTASFSQARRLTVITKTTSGAIAVREWDLDYVEREDEWRLLKEPTIDIKAWKAQLDRV